MTTIDRYLFREIGVPTVLAFGVVAFVAMLRGIVEQLDDMSLDLLQVADIARLAIYSLPAFVGYIIPLTYLMGMLFAYSRLATRSELIAMRAAGISLRRLAIPAIVVGALLSGFSFVIQDRIQPWALHKTANLLYNELPLRATVDMLPTGVMHSFDDWRVYIGRREETSSTLYDLVILRPEAGGVAAYYADSARLVRSPDGNAKLELRNGLIIPPEDEERMTPLRFGQAQLSLPMPEPVAAPGARERRTIGELLATEEKLSQEMAATPSVQTQRALLGERQEIMLRFALPLMCFAVSIIAAPLGVRAPRAGKSYAFAVGVAVVALYFVLQSLTQLPLLLPLAAAVALGQSPNVVLVALGAVMLWRTDRL